MPIHECAHAFEALASTVLPERMLRMRAAMAHPWQMARFAQPKIGTKSLLKELALPKDFPGCYVLIEHGTAVYVGISRGVIGRLRQHVYGNTHFDASLAYRIAFSRHPDRTVETWTRSRAMQDQLFSSSFRQAQSYLRSLQVAAIEIENALERYVFEP